MLIYVNLIIDVSKDLKIISLKILIYACNREVHRL